MESRQGSLSGEEKENEAIHGILVRILEKWRMEIGASEEDLEKTVILSSESVERKEMSPPSKPIKVMEEAVPETVIILPKENKPGTSISSPAVKSKGPDSIKRPEEPSGKGEFLEETVILKAGKVREKVNE
ncbi:MAG: hypothetical protein FJ115_17290 [Deltaproteobacteria bacterium]|nr:hypothetical protein [Deltaproteobacteria bacterium]MBM4348053.1 hypothetical protein [Deltaproteobacteria bacterium]